MTTTAQPIKRLLPNGGVLFACGCRTYNEGGFLYLCPLHAAAPRMLASWQSLLTEWEASPKDQARKAAMLDHWAAEARAILRALEG